ncbi:MAG: hypothetical protein CME32_31415 [Gimesia sp.]|nr:hypothetical protein [Gimesia sp.]
MDYFQILLDDEHEYGVATAIDYNELFFLPRSGAVSDWHPIKMKLTEGTFVDYLANDLGCRLCSRRLKNILQLSAALDDEFQWLPVEVHKQREMCSYYILHFPNPPDILDKKRSLFAGDFVVKPAFSRDKIGGHQVFVYPKAGELKLFVSEAVKLAIEKEACTGMELSRVPVQ